MQPKKKERERKGYGNRLNDKISELEKELSSTKYNKRTQGAVGLLKAKIARLKEKEVTRGKGGGKTDGYQVRKTGDGTAILVGFPSVGKSTLLNAMTNAQSAVAAYAFTTLTVIPGTLEYRHAKIQILDVPGIVMGAASGRGRGKEVLATALSSDLVLILLEVNNPEHLPVILQELYDTNIRLNKKKPNVKITKTAKGGVRVGFTIKPTKINAGTIREICRELRITNADVVVREDVDEDEFIDVVEGNKKYVPALVIVNKVDVATPEQLARAREICKPDLEVSANTKLNIERLKTMVYDKLELMSIYCKEVGKEADMDVPMIMFRGATLRDMCDKLHKDFAKKFKYARVWGKSVKFEGQKILKLEHVLADGDVVEIHLR